MFKEVNFLKGVLSVAWNPRVIQGFQAPNAAKMPLTDTCPRKVSNILRMSTVSNVSE